MVYLRNIVGLLLALAAAPLVTATPVAANDLGLVVRAGKGLDIPLVGGDDSSSSLVGSDSDTASATPSASPSASPSETPSDTPSASPTPTPTPTPTSDTHTPTSTDAAPTSSVNSPSQAQTSSEVVPKTTTAPASTSQSASAQTSSLNVITLTNSAGAASTAVVYATVLTTTGGRVIGTATSIGSVPTEAAAANSNGKNDDSHDSGPANKGAIIGGVVGGVGGAILIAALAAVAWRIWGKNRHRNDEDDALMDDGIYGTSEVKTGATGPTSGASPFQNNLEQYHAPGRTNPSANF